MKTKIILLIIFPILIIICNQNLNAQKIITSDSLIGEWEYFSTGDTVILINHTIDKAKDYGKWIFKSNNNFTEIASKIGGEKKKGLAVESVQVKWYYDEGVNILKIDRGMSLTKYRLNNFDNKTIKLIKIKNDK